MNSVVMTEGWLVGWSLTSHFSTNSAIPVCVSEKSLDRKVQPFTWQRWSSATQPPAITSTQIYTQNAQVYWPSDRVKGRVRPIRVKRPMSDVPIFSRKYSDVRFRFRCRSC